MNTPAFRRPGRQRADVRPSPVDDPVPRIKVLADGKPGPLHTHRLASLSASAELNVRSAGDFDMVFGSLKHAPGCCCIFDFLKGYDVGVQRRSEPLKLPVVILLSGLAPPVNMRGEMLDVPSTNGDDRTFIGKKGICRYANP